jgi:epoxyqueuosine reductase
MALSADVKAYARSLDFALVGITSAEPFPDAEQHTLRWLREGHQAEMAWLSESRARLAAHPNELLPGARSLIVVGAPYRTAEPDAEQPLSGRVSRYAWGSDYHDAMRSRLRLLAAFVADAVGEPVHTRAFVDSGPLLERDAAARAGLGFRGKNTNLLTPIGSYVFLGALLTDVALEPDAPIDKDCGSCQLCIDACPTRALDNAYHLAAERCIAYLTIEHRGPVEPSLRPLLGDWIFGCDVCQEVCPYNASRRNRAPGWTEFEPRHGPRLDLPELLALDDEAFRGRFKGSPLKRTKRRGLARNAAYALGNSGDERAREALEGAAKNDPEPVVRDAAGWALDRLTELRGG